MSTTYVLLQCVNEGNKLRVKMMSSFPYIKGKNCQFPRSIRVEGMYYVVKSEHIKLQSSSFYSMRKEDNIVVSTMNFSEIQSFFAEEKIDSYKIYGDDDDNECIVCLSDLKTEVFIPCGHYVCCKTCSIQCKTCPMCRSKVGSIINRNNIS